MQIDKDNIMNAGLLDDVVAVACFVLRAELQ